MRAKTSKTSPILINHVVPENKAGGWVAVTLAPGKNTRGTHAVWRRDLDADLDRLKTLGVTVLVPLLTDEDLGHLGIHQLVPEAEERGLEVLRFPIQDGSVPADLNSTVAFCRDLARRAREGQRVLVHCNGGLGRAGTIAACVRLASGLDPDPATAIAAVRKARGPRAIENSDQEEFVTRFQEALKASPEPGPDLPEVLPPLPARFARLAEPPLWEQRTLLEDKNPPGTSFAALVQLQSIDLVGREIFRVRWRFALPDGRESSLSALVDANSNNYFPEEPFRNWTLNLFTTNKNPMRLEGDNRACWFVCHILHEQIKVLTASGVLTISGAFVRNKEDD